MEQKVDKQTKNWSIQRLKSTLRQRTGFRRQRQTKRYTIERNTDVKKTKTNLKRGTPLKEKQT